MQNKSGSFSKSFILFLILAATWLNMPSAKAQRHIYPPEEARWPADSLGNQRAVVQVKKNVKRVTVALDWRNRNVAPDQQVYVVDSTSNQLVQHTTVQAMTPEQGVITFETVSGPGIYYVYYLPYRLGGRSRYYPDAIYKTRDQDLAPGRTKLSSGKEAVVLRMEAVDVFNSNYPMEVIATLKEVERFRHKYSGKDYLVFPESREFPIKMQRHLPQRWVLKPLKTIFTDQAKRGEHFTFQLGVWPVTKDLEDVRVTFSALQGPTGSVLPAQSITCFNTEGVAYTGAPMTKTVSVKQGEVQALWCGLQVPEQAPAGTYRGTATIAADNAPPTTVAIELHVSQELAQNGGIGEPWKQTRLQWLNSTLAQENTVIAPYTPLQVAGNTVSLLGRKLILAPGGLPQQIQSFFTEEMTGLSTQVKEILSSPFAFRFADQNGQEIEMGNAQLSFLKKEPGTVAWQARSSSPQLTMDVKGTIEFDGFVAYEVQVIANQEVNLSDIALGVPMNAGAARYMLGLGHKGGERPEQVEWKWDVAHKNQDGVWLGSVNAGLQLSLRDQHYERPLNTNFYLQKPLVLPASWGNEDKGGININQQGSVVQVNSYSGERQMHKGDTLFYNFTLLITPFHPLQTDAHWQQRYYHAYQPIDSVVQSGANTINIHHGNELNPYINYPFIATKEMKAYIDAAHKAGLKVKVYNTVREVSDRLYELYPLRSLGHEVFSPGPGKGYSWLQEHLQGDYIAAWFVPRFKDAAIINSGMSRWHNYYVEGMNWLVDSVGIDGIYLDDVAFDRITMKRIKRVMTKNGHPGIIDLHSANQYNERDGFNNSAYLYMEHFPYLNRLWFGEYFDYEQGSPGFYLTEVSGIPFGLMGEMLQDGGNPWRGMVYGMTNRMPYQKEKPDQIWKVWDTFGMEGSRMIGYWVGDSPVKTTRNDVLATVYQKDNKALVSIASWAPANTSVKLIIDWKKLGIDPKKAKITAPEIRDFQSAAVFKTTDEIPVEKNKGWLLLIE